MTEQQVQNENHSLRAKVDSYKAVKYFHDFAQKDNRGIYINRYPDFFTTFFWVFICLEIIFGCLISFGVLVTSKTTAQFIYIWITQMFNLSILTFTLSGVLSVVGVLLSTKKEYYTERQIDKFVKAYIEEKRNI